ncbi:unnamed protein product [Ranitomeya imitator]|uniref:Noggin n=1 Tax=Ranitomeya imitator TaxID=111125 RepID=A0ABN9M319_9NEOB|nr:unnamed protein product [Ranitomeya imitator]
MPVTRVNIGFRPSPSGDLPVLPVIEHPDPEQDPKEQDLDERTLRKKLGSNFDPNFMAVVLPNLVNMSTQDSLTKTKTLGSLPIELKKMDLSEAPYGGRIKIGKKARRKFLQWLWAYTYCPVCEVTSSSAMLTSTSKPLTEIIADGSIG